MKLIKIPGTKAVYVNPEYVTSVYPAAKAHQAQGFLTEIEYEGNAGYRTRTVQSTATPEEIAELLQASDA